jgi:hypothetical protein
MNVVPRSVVLAVLAALALSTTSDARHSWGKYHWARTTQSFTLKVGDNVSSSWDSYLNEAIADWNPSNVLQLTKVTGGTTGAACQPTLGRIEACNAAYGTNGWLGIAQIWATRSHITQALTKVNDTYFNTATYNTPAWRRLVMCQEIAHDFGLDHQDERFDNPNLGSCMDYTNDPDGGAGGASSTDPSNEHPNAHDFEQLERIYGHADSSTSVGAATAVKAAKDLNHPSAWGQLVRSNASGRVQVFERDLGPAEKLITVVFWADLEHDHHGRH